MNMLYFFKNHRIDIILGPVFKLIESIFELIIPMIMASIIDYGVKSQDTSYILKMGYVIVVLAILGYISAIMGQYMAARASQGIGAQMREIMYEKINFLECYQIDKIGTASIVTRITSDIQNIQNAIAMTVRVGMRVPFVICGALVMSYIVDKKLSTIYFIIAPSISIILILITLRSTMIFTQSRYKLDKISSLCKENLDGARVIRAFSRQNSEIKRFNDATVDYVNKGIDALKVFSLMPPAAYFIVNVSIMAVIWIGAKRIDIGQLEPGKITALISYVTQILFAVFLASSLINLLTKAWASYKRVLYILNIQPEDSFYDISKNLNFSDVSSENAKIEFKNVSFSYNVHGESELQNINFSLKSGETLGIIGSTGSGKTTILNLLLRFYIPSSGNILIDQKNINSYDVNFLREKIKVVPQSAVLFSGTIEENLRMGNNKIQDSDIYQALRLSHSIDFVNSKPDGIKSFVERGGKNFSGGQRQRLTIARALVSIPDILILDDCMSALDAQTSSKLQASLNSIKGITKIIISQKFINIVNADKIIVMENGTIEGIGTHRSLLENSSLYQEIYKSQIG